MIVTVPDNIALSVEIDAVELADDAKRVAVSALRALKEYEVLGVNPLNVGDVCHVPLFISYSHPVIVVSVILVDVLPDFVGAEGAVCVFALVTVAVALEETLPLQFAALTVTVMVLPISSCTKVYEALFVPILVLPRFH